jgi:hypothetical protein
MLAQVMELFWSVSRVNADKGRQRIANWHNVTQITLRWVVFEAGCDSLHLLEFEGIQSEVPWP